MEVMGEAPQVEMARQVVVVGRVGMETVGRVGVKAGGRLRVKVGGAEGTGRLQSSSSSRARTCGRQIWTRANGTTWTRRGRSCSSKRCAA